MNKVSMDFYGEIREEQNKMQCAGEALGELIEDGWVPTSESDAALTLSPGATKCRIRITVEVLPAQPVCAVCLDNDPEDLE